MSETIKVEDSKSDTVHCKIDTFSNFNQISLGRRLPINRMVERWTVCDG